MSRDETSTRRTVLTLYVASLVVFTATFTAGGYTVGLFNDVEVIGTFDDPNYLQAGILTPSESTYLGSGVLTPTEDTTETTNSTENTTSTGTG